MNIGNNMGAAAQPASGNVEHQNQAPENNQHNRRLRHRLDQPEALGRANFPGLGQRAMPLANMRAPRGVLPQAVGVLAPRLQANNPNVVRFANGLIQVIQQQGIAGNDVGS